MNHWYGFFLIEKCKRPGLSSHIRGNDHDGFMRAAFPVLRESDASSIPLT